MFLFPIIECIWRRSDVDVVICAFSDREIQFYELSSFEPYCQITGLESVPLKMDYWYLAPASFFFCDTSDDTQRKLGM